VTVGEALALARELGVARLDAQLLLAHGLGRSRSWLLAHDEAPAGDAAEALLRRRAAGEPLAYLVGQKEFHGLMFEVRPAVLIPRPDTETLVDWAIDILDRAGLPSPAVLDLGTGSGAIAVSVKHARPQARVTALDASPEALAVARRNAQPYEIELLPSDWWSAVGGRRFDLLLSNPPYIADGDPHLAALTAEPLAALTSGPDGLAAIRVLIGGAAKHMHAGAWLLLEHGHDQASAVSTLFTYAGFSTIEQRRDLAGHVRCTGAQIG
jgi:release factor glutamine methyltransferase